MPVCCMCLSHTPSWRPAAVEWRCPGRSLALAAPALLPLQLQWNLRGLVEMIFDYLKLIRIYTKPKGALVVLPMLLLGAVCCSGAGQCSAPYQPA